MKGKKVLQKFDEEEDERLKYLISTLGTKSWLKIAEQMGNRTSRQCKERWEKYLSPEINKDEWTEDEDRLLLQLHKRLGSKWTKLVKNFKNRTTIQLRNRYNVLERKLRREEFQNKIISKHKEYLDEINNNQNEEFNYCTEEYPYVYFPEVPPSQCSRPVPVYETAKEQNCPQDEYQYDDEYLFEHNDYNDSIQWEDDLN